MRGVADALEAADRLAAEGIEVEVIDLRALRPLDMETILGSVSKTNRILAFEEGPWLGGWAAGVLGSLTAAALHDLDDAWSVNTAELPIPYSPTLEDAFLPGVDQIVSSVLERGGIR